MKTVVSGIQPTGILHIGNYFGAVKQHIEMQNEYFCIYFIASYHALTTIHDGNVIRENTINLAMDYIALGLNPNKVLLFSQADVPEITELSWILSTVTGMGLISRSHAYKDKVAKGIDSSVGLFSYPILMAADILAYNADIVPVGVDQVQHVQITRDIASKFNKNYKKVFNIPEFKLSDRAKVIGVDGQKMSKSYNNTLPVFAEGKLLKKIIDSIKTDSTPVGERKDPEQSILFSFYSFFSSSDEIDEMRQRFLNGIGYSEVKGMLIKKIDERFVEAREIRKTLNRNDIIDILKQNGAKAKVLASTTLEQVRDASGLNYNKI